MGSHYSNKCEIWHGGTDRSVKFHLYRGRNVGVQPTKLSKFGILLPKSHLRGESLHSFTKFSAFVHIYRSVAFKFLIWLLLGDKQPSYKEFPIVGAFSHKFSIGPSGKTTDRIKKVRGCKNGTDLFNHHAMYGGDRGSRAGCRWKVMCGPVIPHAKFCKNRLRGCTPLGQIYTKNYQFWSFWAL